MHSLVGITFDRVVLYLKISLLTYSAYWLAQYQKFSKWQFFHLNTRQCYPNDNILTSKLNLIELLENYGIISGLFSDLREKVTTRGLATDRNWREIST